MSKDKKGTYIGLVGTLIVHLLLLLLLLFAYFLVPEPEEESGVPIMMGLEELAVGGNKVAPYIEVDVMPTPARPRAPEPTTPKVEEKIITQDVEETVTITPKEEKKEVKKEVKKEPEKKPIVPPKKEVKPVEKPEKTEKEIAEEKAKAEAIRVEQERKRMEEAARNRVANAFGKGSQMEGQNTGTERVNDGVDNASTVSTSNQSGYGTFDLGGRSIGKGGLPRPVYNVPEEGVVVVTITVNPQGKVVSTGIHKSSLNATAALKKAAEDAAMKAQFNTIKGFDNQIGTITYYFKLK